MAALSHDRLLCPMTARNHFVDLDGDGVKDCPHSVAHATCQHISHVGDLEIGHMVNTALGQVVPRLDADWMLDEENTSILPEQTDSRRGERMGVSKPPASARHPVMRAHLPPRAESPQGIGPLHRL